MTPDERDAEIFKLASEGRLMMDCIAQHELHRQVLGMESIWRSRFLATPDPAPDEPGEEHAPVEEPDEDEGEEKEEGEVA